MWLKGTAYRSELVGFCFDFLYSTINYKHVKMPFPDYFPTPITHTCNTNTHPTHENFFCESNKINYGVSLLHSTRVTPHPLPPPLQARVDLKELYTKDFQIEKERITTGNICFHLCLLLVCVVSPPPPASAMFKTISH